MSTRRTVPERAGDRWVRARSGMDPTRVGLIDIAPTILDVLGIEAPASFEGVTSAAPAPTPSHRPDGPLAEATRHDGERKSYTEDARARLRGLSPRTPASPPGPILRIHGIRPASGRT